MKLSIAQQNESAINFCLALRNREMRKGNERARHRTHDCLSWRDDNGKLLGTLSITLPCEAYPKGKVIRRPLKKRVA